MFSPGAEILLLDAEFLPSLMLNALSVPLVLWMSRDGLVSVGWAVGFGSLELGVAGGPGTA